MANEILTLLQSKINCERYKTAFQTLLQTSDVGEIIGHQDQINQPQHSSIAQLFGKLERCIGFNDSYSSVKQAKEMPICFHC